MTTVLEFIMGSEIICDPPSPCTGGIAHKSKAPSDAKRALQFFGIETKERSAAAIAKEIWEKLKDPDMSDTWNRHQGMYSAAVKAAKSYENRAMATPSQKLPFREVLEPRASFDFKGNTYVVKIVDNEECYRLQDNYGTEWLVAEKKLVLKNKKERVFRMRLRKALKSLKNQYLAMGK